MHGFCTVHHSKPEPWATKEIHKIGSKPLSCLTEKPCPKASYRTQATSRKMSMEEDKEFEAELLKLDENGEIYVGRPLPQEEQRESSAKSSENAASAKHQLYPLRSGSKNIKADEQFIKSDVKSIRKQAEQDFVNALTRFHQRHISSSKNELIRGRRPKNNITARKT